MLLLIPLLWISACAEEEMPYSLPYARVGFQIDIHGIDSDLTPFSHKSFTQGRTAGESTGYGGLLVFRTIQDEIYAYDLSCPYEKDKSITVHPETNGEAVCPECGSVFVIMYGHVESGGIMYGLGTPRKGPATERLQSYPVRTIPQRNGVFLITN